jgi:hypothetical protein
MPPIWKSGIRKEEAAFHHTNSMYLIVSSSTGEQDFFRPVPDYQNEGGKTWIPPGIREFLFFHLHRWYSRTV